MYQMFAELFLTPDEELEADDRHRLRGARRSRQLKTPSAARGPSGLSRTALAARTAA